MLQLVGNTDPGGRDLLTQRPTERVTTDASCCVGWLEMDAEFQSSGSFLPLPNLVLWITFLLVIVRTSSSVANPCEHVGSSVVSEADAWRRKNSLWMIRSGTCMENVHSQTTPNHRAAIYIVLLPHWLHLLSYTWPKIHLFTWLMRPRGVFNVQQHPSRLK